MSLSTLDQTSLTALPPTRAVALPAGSQPGAAGLPQTQRSFLEALGIEQRGFGQPGSERTFDAAPADTGGDVQKGRETAERLVATTLIQPILASAREANQAPPPFGPTQAEKTFGGLMDATLAVGIARASGFDLVNRIASDLGAGARHQAIGKGPAR